MRRILKRHVGTAGYALAVIGLATSFLPSSVRVQTSTWNILISQLQGLEINSATPSPSWSRHPIYAGFFTGAAIVALFFVMSLLQTAAYTLLSHFDADRRWFTEQQGKVSLLKANLSPKALHAPIQFLQNLRQRGIDVLCLLLKQFCPFSPMSHLSLCRLAPLTQPPLLFPLLAVQVLQFMSLVSDHTDLSFDSIVFALRETVSSIFGDDILLKLAFIEHEGDVELARLQIINSG